MIAETAPGDFTYARNGNECLRVITDIGKAANVKAAETTRDGKTRVTWASAHDLRRAFGARWSTRIMPAVLQQLMRHESIETTLAY